MAEETPPWTRPEAPDASQTPGTKEHDARVREALEEAVGGGEPLSFDTAGMLPEEPFAEDEWYARYTGQLRAHTYLADLNSRWVPRLNWWFHMARASIGPEAVSYAGYAGTVPLAQPPNSSWELAMDVRQDRMNEYAKKRPGQATPPEPAWVWAWLILRRTRMIFSGAMFDSPDVPAGYEAVDLRAGGRPGDLIEYGESLVATRNLPDAPTRDDLRDRAHRFWDSWYAACRAGFPQSTQAAYPLVPTPVHARLESNGTVKAVGTVRPFVGNEVWHTLNNFTTEWLAVCPTHGVVEPVRVDGTPQQSAVGPARRSCPKCRQPVWVMPKGFKASAERRLPSFDPNKNAADWLLQFPRSGWPEFFMYVKWAGYAGFLHWRDAPRRRNRHNDEWRTFTVNAAMQGLLFLTAEADPESEPLDDKWQSNFHDVIAKALPAFPASNSSAAKAGLMSLTRAQTKALEEAGYTKDDKKRLFDLVAKGVCAYLGIGEEELAVWLDGLSQSPIKVNAKRAAQALEAMEKT